MDKEKEGRSQAEQNIVSEGSAIIHKFLQSIPFKHYEFDHAYQRKRVFKFKDLEGKPKERTAGYILEIVLFAPIRHEGKTGN